MKRHESLHTLTSHHQHVLTDAKRLRDASRSDGDDERRAAANAFLDRWRREGRLHFREEEELVLPTMGRFADPRRPEITEMLMQHVLIRGRVDELASTLARDEVPSPAALEGLGRILDDHVRLEEHVVFPAVEAAVPEEELGRLKERIAEFHARLGEGTGR